MGISDEIKDVTIAIDETTILEMKAMIAFPINFDNVRRAMMGKKSGKTSAASASCLFRVFVLLVKLVTLIYLFFRFRCLGRSCSNLLLASPRKTIQS